MAVPTSGMLSLVSIRREIGVNNYNGTGYTTSGVSLFSCSAGGYGTINTANATTDRPDTVAPHAMSEFYGYDHDKVSLTSFDGAYATSGGEACAAEEFVTYYHDGDDFDLANGDRIYTESDGGSELSSGTIKQEGASIYWTYTNGTGVGVSSGCGRSERRLKYNIEFIGDSPMGIPMYHFNYKNEEHGKGRFVGTMVDDLQRLGFEDNVFEKNGEFWVMYDSRIDVPFESVTN